MPSARPAPLPFFSFGFRPFFFGAAVWAVLGMGLWIGWQGGHDLPTGFDPVSWHAHEFLFGYTMAVIAGFLLTAVPNWTGRAPVAGAPLAGLFTLWLLGRAAMGFGRPSLWVALADLALPVALILVIGRELVAAQNHRNMKILILLGVFSLGNAQFHYSAITGGFAGGDWGMRLGLMAVLMMIAVIGGRIIPLFTRNWLNKAGILATIPGMTRFDVAALGGLFLALGAWVLAPDHRLTAGLLCLAGGLHLIRVVRWQGLRSLAEPLVFVLHVAYLWLPLGAFAVAAGIFWPDLITPTAALHPWMAGAIGLMTLAVMSRASLGHTGRALHAGAGTTVAYIAVALSAVARSMAGIWPDWATPLYHIAGGAWALGFALYATLYAKLLFSARKQS